MQLLRAAALGDCDIGHSAWEQDRRGAPLRDLDEVAYLRFASVYRRLESLDDFEKAIVAEGEVGTPHGGGDCSVRPRHRDHGAVHRNRHVEAGYSFDCSNFGSRATSRCTSTPAAALKTCWSMTLR